MRPPFSPSRLLVVVLVALTAGAAAADHIGNFNIRGGDQFRPPPEAPGPLPLTKGG